jgi:hypothetical protein
MTDDRMTMPWVDSFDPPRGTAILNGLSNVNVPCPTIQANSLIFMSIIQVIGTVGVFFVSGITPGVGFSIASVALNVSKVSWLVLEP